MTDKPSIEPMNLPAGSYELSDIEKVGEKIAAAPVEKRREVENREVAKIRQIEHDERDVSLLPGHRLETVERVLQEGVEQPVIGGKKGETETVGAVTVTETIQVFDPKVDQEQQEAGAEAIPATEAAAAPAGAAGSKEG